MAIVVRPLRFGEERTFLEIHSRSVRELAGIHYSHEVIDAWAARTTDEHVRRFLANVDGEIVKDAAVAPRVNGISRQRP